MYRWKLNLLTLAIVFVVLLAVPPFCWAQSNEAPCSSPRSFSGWTNCRRDLIVTTQVKQLTAARVNQSEPMKQVETSSLAENTTSLVEQSKAPDFIGVALNLAGLSSNVGKNETTSGAITATAYALYATAAKQDPLDPAFYLKNSELRRFSFTLGRELPDAKDASSQNRATILGFKVLAVNKRDLSTEQNRDKLAELAKLLEVVTIADINIDDEIEKFLYQQLAPQFGLPVPGNRDSEIKFSSERLKDSALQETLKLLTADQLKRVDAIIEARISSKVALNQKSRQAIEEIRRAPQLAFIFQSKLRDETGVDEYRTGVTFDYGVYRRINLTINATFDYQDSKKIGGDKRGGRIAGETYFLLTPEKNVFGGRGPMVFSIAGESKWFSGLKPTHLGQVKLTIPIASGIDFPISLTVANRNELIKETTVRGRFGFTFDVAKLLKGFGGNTN